MGHKKNKGGDLIDSNHNIMVSKEVAADFLKKFLDNNESMDTTIQMQLSLIQTALRGEEAGYDEYGTAEGNGEDNDDGYGAQTSSFKINRYDENDISGGELEEIKSNSEKKKKKKKSKEDRYDQEEEEVAAAKEDDAIVVDNDEEEQDEIEVKKDKKKSKKKDKSKKHEYDDDNDVDEEEVSRKKRSLSRDSLQQDDIVEIKKDKKKKRKD